MVPSELTLPNPPFVDEENQPNNFMMKLEDRINTLELENINLKKEVEEVKRNQITKTNFKNELDQNLEAAALQQSTSSDETSILRNILYGHTKNNTKEDELDQDCYVLMMFNPILSTAWFLGFLTFFIQLSLVSLLISDEASVNENETTMGIPITGFPFMRRAQFLTILLAVASQTDILNGFRTMCLLQYGKEQWPKVLNKESNPSINVWLKYVFIPSFLKMLEGALILAATFLVIVKSERVIELLKDFTALFVISEVDDLFFQIAGKGYFGSKLRKKANELKKVKIEENGSQFASYQVLFFAIITACMYGCWVYVIVGQLKVRYYKQLYPFCLAVVNFKRE